MTPRKPPKRPPGLDNLLDYIAGHVQPCCPSGDDDPDPTVHDPSCWFPGYVDHMERVDADLAAREIDRLKGIPRASGEGAPCDASDSPVTAFQERTLWHIYHHGTVTTLTQRPEDWDRSIGWPTIQSLTAKGLVFSERLPTLGVAGVDGQSWMSPSMWRASLTRAGQEWIGERLSRMM